MKFGRQQKRLSSGWTQAAIFNAMLLLLPVLAANVVSGVFAARDFPQTPRPAALEATRAEIKAQFVELASDGDQKRAYWASLVDLQLRERNMPAARGFLLAAPEMLDERDREAVQQAAPQAVPFGTQDEQLVGAALLFLPNDVRVRYETANRPVGMDMAVPAVDVADAEPETSDALDALETPEPVQFSAPSDAGFSVLGNFEDLVRNGQDWLAGETTQSFSLRVTGLGLLTDRLDPPGTIDLREATSLLKAADRAARLHRDFREDLSEDLDAALPDEDLRAAMAEALSPGSTMAEQAAALEEAFLATARQDALPAIYAQAGQINEIVDATSPVATLAMLEHVSSETDLRRARLVAESGGDRAVALEAVIGRNVLYAARTGIELTREDVLEIMGLAAAAMALFWMVMLSFQRYVRSPVQPLEYYE
ncbi:MAG: hypothetical protein AAFQ22_10665 [Pseudomonadota bacterium]